MQGLLSRALLVLLANLLDVLHIHGLAAGPVQDNLLHARGPLLALVVLYEDAQLAHALELHEPAQIKPTVAQTQHEILHAHRLLLTLFIVYQDAQLADALELHNPARITITTRESSSLMRPLAAPHQRRRDHSQAHLPCALLQHER